MTASLADLTKRFTDIVPLKPPVDPATLGARLKAAGFTDVRVEPNPFAVAFWATAT